MATEKNDNKFMVSEDRYDRICAAVQSRYQEMPENLFFTKEDIDRYLMPELQQYVDAGKIKMRPAVELSYLNEEAQRNVFNVINETELLPSHGQAICMRKAFKTGKLDRDAVKAILSERKPKQPATLRIHAERIENIIPSGITPKELEDYVVKALEYYRRYLQRQRDDAR